MRSNEEQTRLIAEKYTAQTANRQKKKKQATAVLTVCVCLALLTWLVAGSDRSILTPDDRMQDQNDSSGLAETDSQTSQRKQEPTGEAAYQSSASTKGIYIPPIQIPETDDENATMDMLAMVTYNGRVYVMEYAQDEYEPVLNDDIAKLLGEYVGTGNGKITCWSDESDYEGQFASNTTYDFYTVNGYDPAFRLAAIREFADGTYIGFFDCLNGIYLETGADLFEELLHLSGNYGSVTYQLHDDWDYTRGNFKPLDAVSAEDMQTFIDTLYAQPFVDVSDTELAHTIYDREQAHLYFKMHDGTTVGIRMFAGGYVGLATTSARVYVYMPGEIFDTVFAAATE